MFCGKSDTKRFASPRDVNKLINSGRQLRSSNADKFYRLDHKEQLVVIGNDKFVICSPDESNVDNSTAGAPAHPKVVTVNLDEAPTDFIVEDSAPTISPLSEVEPANVAYTANSDDEMAESLTIGPSLFDGSSSQDPQMWISGLQDFIKYKGLDDDKSLALFKLRLSSNARTWLTTLPAGKQDTFGHLKTAFLERFQPQELEKFRFAKELFNQKQQPGQSVDSFITDLKSKASLVDMDAKSQLWAALNGLLPHISAYVLEHTPESLDDVLRHARVVEMTRGSANHTTDDCISKQLDSLAQQMSSLTTKMNSMTTAAISNSSNNNSRHVTFNEPRSRSISPARYDSNQQINARNVQPRPRNDAWQHNQRFNYQSNSYTQRPTGPTYQQQQPDLSRFPPQQQQQQPCGRCGRVRGHTNPLLCAALNYTCHHCGKPGHSYRVCRNRQQN